MAPLAGEPVVLKQQINSFRDTELKQLLDEQGIEHLVIVGAMSHMCIDAGARAAADFGYEVSVAHDACATLDLSFDGKTVAAADVHHAYMSALSFGYGRVASTDELLADL
ncbi:isochorismatase family protein [Aliamphritea spongicola]|nr:isochorismatase family protein [Aliamphritea spongicola]